MAFHAKALEVFTLAYQSIQNVDEEEDLEVRLVAPRKTAMFHWLSKLIKFYLQAAMCHITAFV